MLTRIRVPYPQKLRNVLVNPEFRMSLSCLCEGHSSIGLVVRRRWDPNASSQKLFKVGAPHSDTTIIRTSFVRSIHPNGLCRVLLIPSLKRYICYRGPDKYSKVQTSHTLHPNLWAQSNKRSTILTRVLWKLLWAKLCSILLMMSTVMKKTMMMLLRRILDVEVGPSCRHYCSQRGLQQ